MEKVIEDYKKGNFCYEPGSLEFSCTKLELMLKKDEVWEGSFLVSANAAREITGFAVSQSVRMECLTAYFDQPESCIECRYDGRGLEEGSVLQGEICIVSSQGEYTLPYIVTVEHSKIESSIGQVKNLFHFANLAQSSWQEAVRLFYDVRFQKVFQGNDAQYYTAYKGLRNKPGSESNVEEFLLEINKKQKIEYQPVQQEILLKDPKNVVGQVLEITRNGWGYTHVDIIAEGDFLAVEKQILQEEDFQANVCRLDYFISAKRLHAGNNYGSITIKSIYHSVTVPVTVICSGEYRHAGDSRQAKNRRKRNLYELTECYLDYRMGKKDKRDWMESTGRILETFLETDANQPAVRLYQAQLLITRERCNEAEWVLEHVVALMEEKKLPAEVYCYYRYLTTLCRREADYTNEVAEEVRAIYRSHTDQWRIGWLLLYLEDAVGQNEQERWQLLEEMFSYHCTSPILYIEALDMLKANPVLMMRLNDFEIQVLFFAAQHKLLTEEMVRQIHYPVGRMKQFSGKMLKVLKECYAVLKDDETLYAICAHLIKGSRVGTEYFQWYSMGVEKGLRITRLYEYYMMSVDEKNCDTIPKMVQMYFAYQNDLNYEKKAFLYAYIVRRKDDFPEMYQTYRMEINRFVTEQIRKGYIDDNLAYLYENVAMAVMTEQLADDFVPMLFMHRISVRQKDLKKVVVIYGKKRGSISYPLSHGQACFPVYGDDFKIFLEDQNKNRYVKGIPYRLEKLMVPGKMAKKASQWVADNLDFDLYLCLGGRNYIVLNEQVEERAARIAKSEDLEYSYRRELSLQLMKYYFEQDRIGEMDRLLTGMEPEQFTAEERALIIRYMITREFYDKAFEWVSRYGLEEMDPKSIVRLCTRILAEDYRLNQENLTSIIYYAFLKGKYNDIILKHLIKYFEGTVKQMRDIWKAAEEFEVDTCELCERLLLQMLFSGAFAGEETEIFSSYIKKGTKQDIIMAFLSHLSFEYFVHNSLIDERIWEIVKKLHRIGESMPNIVYMAYAKYAAEEKEDPDEEEQQFAVDCVEEMCRKNIFFPFCLKFAVTEKQFAYLADKTMLEYRAKPDSKVLLYYMIVTEQAQRIEEETEYHKQEMHHMFGGIFVETFVLFFGDRLQYYITEEIGGEETVMESGTLGSNEVGRSLTERRFGIINDVIAGTVLQDYNTVDSLLMEYGLTDYMVQKLFHIR